jgi:hypothetical protein
MQERVRAVEFVLNRCGLAPQLTKPERTRRQTVPPVPAVAAVSPVAAAAPIKTSIESWPYALVENSDHEA